MATYIPLIVNNQHPNPDVEYLQKQINSIGATHVRDLKGRVEKIFHQLNQKSVSLNTVSVSPQRWPYRLVKDFGVLSEAEEDREQ
jgi:hypothetical protein